MSSQGGLLSIRSKKFVKFGLVLSNTRIWAWILYVHEVSKDGVHVHFVCLCCTHGDFYLRKTPKNKWSNCCLLRVGKDWKFLENMQNYWLCETLEIWKFSSLATFSGVWQVRHFLTNLFQKLYPALHISKM